MDYSEDMFGLKGKTIVITGGGGVIAKAVAEAYLRSGAQVSLWNRSEHSMIENAGKLAEAVPGAAERIQTLVVDTGKVEDVREGLGKTIERFGHVNVLVNGVGGNRGKGAFTDIDISEFESLLSLNLTAGVVVPTKVFASWWIDQGSPGTIINFSSMSSYIPLSGVGA